ncbi:thiamine pyrophosphate-binding protein [Cognatiyoonia sp. IB215446]|uniref:thiamine pyrophosphate-binding protein n=1 Tax=Cognatiyoonia sp. IB215446 TaxID=3097355 RepID=UPI002A172E45|nr:thiamine pyrophosphate-binding protein [Cognatiyoonia sp. IB215446]MDX8349397.1 thiamine pyrophosphate-binding protein [Cognatiyoonia sp. IB215446]
MRAADVIAKRLYDEGCRWAFGLPGGEVLTLLDALQKVGIQFVLCRHENAAGFMAEGTYHRTGAPAILLATVGPGALNGINVVENARQDRVPMMVLTGCVDPETAQVYTHQVLDQGRVFEGITKASFTLNTGAAHVIIDKAIGIATEGRPGPVHIDVPIAVAEAEATGEGVLRPKALPMAPAGDALYAARDALALAKRPLIIAGVDALSDRGAEAVSAAAERLGAPVITTYKAKGLLPEDHPLALGGAGLSPKADDVLLPFVKQADVILAIGYDPIEMRIGWLTPWDPTSQTVIDITAEANHHYMHQATHNFVGDCAASVSAILPETAGEGWPEAEVTAVKAVLAEAFPSGDVWGPAQAISVCQEVLPPGTLATADSGAHRILLSQMWTCGFPRALTQSSGFCTMGCAVPLAMGAQLVERDRTIVSFSGDAGFLMVVGELATAAEQKLRTIFVVFVDASLALIELKQRGRQMTNVGVDFAPTDMAALGRAFGGAGFTARSADELRDALAHAQEMETFSVIAVEIDRKAYDGTF